MKNYLWLTATTETRSTVVVPAFARGFASVCPQLVNGTPMRKRIADGATAAAHKGLGPAPWSPPTD